MAWGIGSSLLLWTNGSPDDDLKNVNKCFSRFVVHELAGYLVLNPLKPAHSQYTHTYSYHPRGRGSGFRLAAFNAA